LRFFRNSSPVKPHTSALSKEPEEAVPRGREASIDCKSPSGRTLDILEVSASQIGLGDEALVVYSPGPAAAVYNEGLPPTIQLGVANNTRGPVLDSNIRLEFRASGFMFTQPNPHGLGFV